VSRICDLNPNPVTETETGTDTNNDRDGDLGMDDKRCFYDRTL